MWSFVFKETIYSFILQPVDAKLLPLYGQMKAYISVSVQATGVLGAKSEVPPLGGNQGRVGAATGTLFDEESTSLFLKPI